MTNNELQNLILRKLENLDDKLDVVTVKLERVITTQEEHTRRGDILEKKVSANTKWRNGMAAVIGFLVFSVPVGLKYLL